MKLLDLFCGAGGAAMGYHRAGFEVVGVDIEPQPHYPFEFHQADTFDYLTEHGHEFDVLHASPPCQKYSRLKSLAGDQFQMLIPQTREAFIRTGKPYIIENVPLSPLVNPITLCGTMFGLPLIRHRLFETYPTIYWLPMSHKCRRVYTGAFRSFSSFKNQKVKAICVVGHCFNLQDAKKAMGIDWMNVNEIKEAIPPVYTEFIGKALINLRNLWRTYENRRR